MLKAPQCHVLVKGFDVKIIEHAGNLADAAEDAGSDLLEDGYLEVRVSNSGTNQFWPKKFEDVLLVTRLRDTNEAPEIVSEYDMCIIGADDSPVRLILKEDTIRDECGVWLMLACESPLTETDDPDVYAGYPYLVEPAISEESVAQAH